MADRPEIVDAAAEVAAPAGVEPPVPGGKAQITGNIGLFYTCYRLSRLGWNVLPTSRNARGIDVVAYKAAGEQFVGLQVKALSRRAPVPLGQSLAGIAGSYWVIVVRCAEDKPDCYIMLPEEVRRAAHRGEKEGRVSFWLQPGAYDTHRYRERWDRLG